MINVGIIDDHISILQAYTLAINSDENMSVVFSSTTGQDLLVSSSLRRIDILVLDYSLSSSVDSGLTGLELARKVKETQPTVKILMSTQHDSFQIMMPCLKLGLEGYLIKSEHDFDICFALKQIAANGRYFSPLADRLRRKYLKVNIKLSDREREVLFHLSNGYTSQEIGEALHVTSYTVDAHKKNLISKLNARNSAHLIRLGFVFGFLKESEGDLDI